MHDLTICAVFKNEAEYLDEWIIYHNKIVGIQHFYLYNNNSNDSFKQVLDKYKPIITLIDWPLDDWQQKLAFKHFCENFASNCLYTAFIDVDEFIAVKSKLKLIDILNHCRIDVLWMPWRIFGTSGHYAKPSGLVIENYIHTHSIHQNKRGKIICKSYLINENNIFSPHKFEYIRKVRKINSDFNKICVYHYNLKSLQDLYEKFKKGDVWNKQVSEIRINKVEKLVQDFLQRYDQTDMIDIYMLQFAPIINSIKNANSK